MTQRRYTSQGSLLVCFVRGTPLSSLRLWAQVKGTHGFLTRDREVMVIESMRHSLLMKDPEDLIGLK